MGLCFGKNETSVTRDLNQNKQEQRFVSTHQVKTTNIQQMSEKDKVTLDLKKVQDQLNNRLNQLEKGMNESHEQALEFLRNKNKIRAKYALEKQKLYEKYQENVLNQDRVISQTIRDVQERFDQAAAGNALKAANKLMVDINKTIDIDDMHEAMGNLQELDMNNDKFNELYKQYVGVGSEEIENQVNKMEADMFKDQLQQHDLNTQKAHISQKHPVQQQQFHEQNHEQQQQQQQQHQQQQMQQQQQQQQQHKQNDDIDDQLAMLA